MSKCSKFYPNVRSHLQLKFEILMACKLYIKIIKNVKLLVSLVNSVQTQTNTGSVEAQGNKPVGGGGGGGETRKESWLKTSFDLFIYFLHFIA